MDEDYGEAVVFDRQGDHAEIDGVVGNRLENLGVVGTLDVDRDVGILLFEIGKDLGEDVQASAFVGPYSDGAAGDVLHLSEGGEHGFTGVQRILHVFLEGLASRRERDLAARTVKELGADLVLEGSNLGGDGGLSAETLLRCPGERGMTRYLEKRFELVKVHGQLP